MYTCEILSNQKVTTTNHLITIKKPAGFTFLPGQYIKASCDARNSETGHFSYFAIASHPDEKNFEFLINSTGVNAGEICHLPVGSSLTLSEAMGPGFPSDKMRGKIIYLVTHGSGISAIKSTILELRKNRSLYGSIRLIYGVRTPDDFAYKKQLRDWMGSLEVFDIISKDPGDSSIWSGEIGYVQDILMRIKPDPENAIVAVAGSETMEVQVKKIFTDFGFSEDLVLRNH